ncbi:DUF4429 domain-containing protein [Mesorhizobium sp. B2-3-5]|uniref:DUF4429 domain-containing protein n=1 Tax=Mesorhizobium sp. B2-3-5 TaxID=2589958 RepID=UPI0011260CEC|nr:DUF4429 domain-containing protein [Mesorhizobium sp. B2-3-5]TPM28717.1 DUF4429 domain-containing protein [Mesorhizobium sp. B2-3-5]
MLIQGVGGAIDVQADRLVIKREGVLSFMTHGLKGDKTIPFTSITAVQFKSAGALTNGYIQFSVQGGVENRNGLFAATSDENSVIFKAAQQPIFAKLRELVEGKISSLKTAATPAPISAADEIEKLASLRERGILSEQEFQQRKKAVLEG